jgi:hypothetical protein
MRRLAERPANVAFMTGNILKEMVSGGGKAKSNGKAAARGSNGSA